MVDLSSWLHGLLLSRRWQISLLLRVLPRIQLHVPQNMAMYVLFSADCHSLSIWQLHTQYNLVTTLKGLSGIECKYAMELGMNIGVA